MLERGDVLLLCSDGLTKHVADREIADVISASTDVAALTDELVNAALDHGGTDNVTVAIARISQ